MSNTKNKRILIYFLAFIIPIVVLLIDYYFVGIFPFGDKTILYRDLSGQYVSYFSELRNAVLGNGGLFYSFTKGLGGNMIGIITYYLMSPLNILIFIFPKTMITEAILTITILKLALCGLTFMYFIKYTFKEINYKSLIFSTAYALMAFNIVYQSNIMWLDAVYLLPLVMVGINKIVNKEGKRFYIIALAVTIMTSFYIGFMVCIFSVMYFLYLILNKMFYEKKDFKFFIRRGITFAISSIISALLSCIVVLPTIYALEGGKSQFAFFKVKLAKDFRLLNLISKLYINRMNDGKILNGLPSIYTGILIIILVALYFLNKKIKMFEKISSLAVFGILVVSLYINKLDYIWHGFNKPAGFPYRFTFIFSFFAVVIAYKSFLKIKDTNIISLGVIILIMILSSAFFWRKHFYNLPHYLIVISLALGIIYCIGLLLISKGINEKTVALIVGLIFFVELGFNAFNTFDNLPYSSRKTFMYYLNDVGAVTNGIQEKDKSFYRLGKTFYFNINDPMLINYRGISHFSSVYKVSLRKMINGMGFLDNNVWTIYDSGSMLTANSLLNIKYVITKKKENVPGFKFLYEDKGMFIYENMYYLEAGFMVDHKLENQEISGNTNPFVSQNELLKSMDREKAQDCYYRINDYKTILNNVTEKRHGNRMVFIKENPNKEASVEFKIKATNNFPMYAFLQSYDKQTAQIELNGKPLSGYSIYNYKVMGLGQYKKGETVTLKINLNTNSFVINDNEIYYLNTNNFKEIYDNLKENQFNITSFTNRVVKGNIDVTHKDNILYTTIPYNTGWKVYVNGKEHPYFEVLGSLTGLKLNPGKYNIEFKFTPNGLYLGAGISIITFGLCIVYVIYDKKKKKASLNNKEIK